MNRIQRKRTRGWKMPPHTVYIGRPTKWGNPIKVMNGCIYIDAGYRRTYLDPWVFYGVGDVKDMLGIYRMLWQSGRVLDVDLRYWQMKFNDLDLYELKGKDLACWCRLDEPCHGDVLIEMVENLPTPPETKD